MIDEVYKRVRSLIDMYNNDYNVGFDLSGIYALFPEEAAKLNIKYEYSWPTTWPKVENPSVYIILSKTGSVLYVGKAKHPGYRLSAYFKHVNYPIDSSCQIIHNNWSSRPFLVLFATGKSEKPYEIASLEEFLIIKLNPSDNIIGKG